MNPTRHEANPSPGEPPALQVLVLGLGNRMRRDDGLGLLALRRLRERRAWPEAVTFVEGGTGGLSLLHALEGKSHLLVLDAIQAPHPPGTLVRATLQDLEPLQGRSLSVHQLAGEDLLRWARALNRLPEHHLLLGLVPASVEMGEGLSPPVAANLEHLVAAAVRVLEQWLALPPKLAEKGSHRDTKDTGKTAPCSP